jgi:pimeloyl-ACP methyl ester carboxylesterase
VEALSLPEAPRPAIPGAERRIVEIETADAGRIALHVSELGAGEPVLMLHGWPQHAGCWRAVAPALAERYRVICPDLRGFGASDAPGRGYEPPTFAADALALLDTLGLERVRIVGHDWGAYTGLLTALRAPERVSALLACSTALPWVPMNAKVVAEVWRSWYAVAMAVAGRPLLTRRPEVLERGIQGPGISEADARAYVALVARPASARATTLLYRAYLRTLRNVVLGRGGWGADGHLTVPTRLLFGTRDPALAPAIVAGDHSAHADDLTVELVEGAHHFIPEERPELVIERALALFEGVRAPG